MTDHNWDMARVEKLRAAMTDAEVETLRAREKTDPRSLTIDEVGVLFLITREKIRKLEGKARDPSEGTK